MPVRAAAHVFVVDLNRPEIADVDRHHLERVLRLRSGEAVTASDGRGGVRPCTFVPGGGLDPSGEVSVAPPRSPSIGVGFALVKADRPEWIVQKLTECGVDRILPFVADRSVVVWDHAKAERGLERLQRISVEAAMQSRQAWLPVVDRVRPFGEVLGPETALADPEGEAPDLRSPTILIGPEGGWSEEERAAGSGRLVRLGPSVLRAETAALAAGILLTALRESLVSPNFRRRERS